jgi:HYR domain
VGQKQALGPLQIHVAQITPIRSSLNWTSVVLQMGYAEIDSTDNACESRAMSRAGPRRVRGAVVTLVAVSGGIAFFGTATPSAPFAAGTLSFRGALFVNSVPLVPCPPGTALGATDCRTRTGEDLVQGLGRVSEAYIWSIGIGPPTCSGTLTKPLATTGRLIVAGKGEIHVALAPGTRCIDLEPVRNEPQTFTITGGTGIYAAASGSGTVQRALSGDSGTETWTGTLIVPALEFDVTAPVISGASSKTVLAPKRAKQVRVTYSVTASDAIDGPLPVSCRPRSGSRLPVGRNVVTCEATDSSANTGQARFVITVKKRR